MGLGWRCFGETNTYLNLNIIPAKASTLGNRGSLSIVTVYLRTVQYIHTYIYTYLLG